MANSAFNINPLTLLQVYPVGSIYMSVVVTNPGTLFGGTWVAYGVGRMLISLDTGDPDFDTPEETGGAKTHTLTTAEMPAHTHTQDAHLHAQQIASAVGGGLTGITGTGNLTGNAASTQSTNNTTATNQNTGGGGAHNNMPPYIATYMFKRTA